VDIVVVTPTPTPTPTNTPTPTPTPNCDFDVDVIVTTPTPTPSSTATPTPTPTCDTSTQYLEVQLNDSDKFKLLLWEDQEFTKPDSAECNYIVSGQARGDLGTVYTGTEIIQHGDHIHQFDLSSVLLPNEVVSGFTVYDITFSGCTCTPDVQFSQYLPTPTPTPSSTPTPTPTPNCDFDVDANVVTPTPSPTPSPTPTPTEDCSYVATADEYIGLQVTGTTTDCQLGIDMVFILDRTGSMGNTIDNLKTSISSYVTKVQQVSNNDYRFGLISVEGEPSNPSYTMRVALSPSNESTLSAGLNTLIADGGLGVPEPTDSALEAVLYNTVSYGPFRNDANKIIVMITDAPPSGDDDQFTIGVDNVKAHNLAVYANSVGVRIFAIAVGGIDSNGISVMNDYATTTYGQYAYSGDGTVSNEIITALDNLCQSAL